MKLPVITQEVLDRVNSDTAELLQSGDLTSHIERMKAIGAANPLLDEQIKRMSVLVGRTILAQGARLESVIAGSIYSVVMLLDAQMEADALAALLGPAPE